MALHELSETEWTQTLQWITEGRGQPRAAYLDALRDAGAPPHLLGAVSLGLELPAASDDPDRHRLGERVGSSIEVHSHLCDGGTASVYLALYGPQHRPAALRLRPLPADPEGASRAREVAAREVGFHEKLSVCGAVPQLYEVGEHCFSDGSCWLYLCTEYKQGLDPQAHCREHQLDLSQRLYLFLQICDVVALLHERGIVHGDIKPANFVVTRHNGRTRVWVLDLGLTAVQGQPWPSDGGIVGTPAYLSPERLATGWSPASTAADVYALGLMLFEMLEERVWLDAPESCTPGELETRMRTLPPPRTMRVAPAALRDRLNTVLGRATAWAPDARYSQVVVLREAVWEILKDTPGSARVQVAPEGVHPYRGLRSFEEAHVEWFFGREDDTRRLAESLLAQGLVTVIGASGSGKSSLLHAGVAPLLRSGRLDDRFEWALVPLRPGRHPLHELALRVSNLIEPSLPVAELEARLREPRLLAHELGRAAVRSSPERRFVLLVDQLEEVFSQCEDAGERSAFVRALIEAAERSDGRIRVLLALRTDFAAVAEREFDLWKAIGRSHFLLEPMGEVHLRSAIHCPAERAGLELEPGLEDLLVQAVLEEPGGLPLLQFVLAALYEEREGRYLTRAAYRRMQGLRGAIARRADAELATLRAAGHETLVRRIFGRLVRPGDGTAPTRRRVAIRELTEMHPDARIPLEQLIQARLLTADGDHVEFAHEALIREWPLLRSWIEEDEDQLRISEAVAQAARIWVQSQDVADLLAGSRLRDALELRESGLLSCDEDRFLAASSAHGEAEERAAEERNQQRLRGAQLRAQRNQLAAILALGAILVLGTIAAWLLRISADQRAKLIDLVQGANAYAVQGQAGAILDQVRERAQRVQQIAQDPAVLSLARGAPRENAPELRRHAEGRFDIVAVFDREGVMTALWGPNRAVIGRDFAFRDYYRIARDLGLRGVRDAYVAHSFLSENDGMYKFGLSAPILDGSEWVGVVLATVLTDSALGPVVLTNREDPRQTGVLVGPRDRDRVRADAPNPDAYIVLIHDRLCSGCSAPLPVELARSLRESFGRGSSEDQLAVADAKPLRIDDYRDPASDDDGRWLATFAPVGRTGFIVGVQTRYDAAVELSERLELDLRALGRQLGATFLAGSLVVLGVGLLYRRRTRAAHALQSAATRRDAPR